MFALVAGLSGVLDVGCFWLLVRFADAPPLWANAASYLIAAVNSFALNRHITFGREDSERAPLRDQLGRFAAMRALCLVVSTIVLAAALAFVPSLAAKLISVAVTFVLAYTLSRVWVYAPPRR